MDSEHGYLVPECGRCHYWHDGSAWDLGCTFRPFDECCYVKARYGNNKNEKHKHVYEYKGPVFMFDKYVGYWKSQTLAVSEGKAKANFHFQWKKEHGYSLHTKITLPGLIQIID